MNRDKLKEFIQGTPAPIPTPFDENYHLDLSRLTDMTQWWVERGLGTNTTAIKVMSAMGQGPDISDDEWPHLLRTVVNAAGSNATVLCALKVKNTLHTIDDARRAQDLGAVGLQIDLPFFHHPDQDTNVRHFTAISDAIDIGIMIYNTHWFCSDPAEEYVNAETMLRLKDAKQVVAIKWSIPDGEDYDQMKLFSDHFNVIDNWGDKVRCHQNGGRGYISGIIPAYPKHDMELWQLLESRRYDEARALGDRISRAFKSGGGSPRPMFAAMGIPIGPPRPPQLSPDDKQILAARKAMVELGWLQ